MSGAEHVPNDMHPGLAPLREVEQGRTISKSSVPIIDTFKIKRFALRRHHCKQLFQSITQFSWVYVTAGAVAQDTKHCDINNAQFVG